MNNITKSMLLLLTAGLLSTQINAEVSFNSARVTAEDVLATAEFYKTALGMHEVERINLPGGQVEVMLNFGHTQQEALANTDAQVVIMHRDAGEMIDKIAHLIFDVTDIEATVAAVKKAGGSIATEPFEFGNTGIKIAMINDPAGNQVEFLQKP